MLLDIKNLLLDFSVVCFFGAIESHRIVESFQKSIENNVFLLQKAVWLIAHLFAWFG